MIDGFVSLLLWLLILAAVSTVLFVGIRGILRRRRQRHQRDDDAKALAARRGWSVDLDAQTHASYEGYPFIGGHDRTSHRTLRGEHRCRKVRTFDYSYRLSNEEVDHLRAPECFTIAGTWFGDGEPLPDLLVVPEGGVRRFLGRATNLDIELESEDFNRAFSVISPDRRFASDLLSPQVMTLMLTWPEVGWRVTGRELLAVRKDWGEVDEVITLLDLAADIMDAVPEFVRAREGGPS